MKKALLATFFVLAAACGDDGSTNPNNDDVNNNTKSCQPTKGGIEVCDGVDNDCDGDIDEDFPTLGDACSQGVGTCSESGVFACAGDEGGVICDSPNPKEPLLACPENTCGVIDDGCGDTLDCGACPCTNGVPDSTTCGQCDIGTYVCQADVTGVGECLAPAGLDQITDLDCDTSIIYVDSAQTQGDGTQSSPFSRYADALAAASPGNVILLSQNPITLDTLANGIHVFGGFEPGTWRFDPTKHTQVISTQEPNGDAVGIRAINLTAATYLSGIDATAPDAANGFSSIGIVVSNSSGLRLSNANITAGRGSNGVSGGAGLPGTYGGSGNDPRAATITNTGNTTEDRKKCMLLAAAGNQFGGYRGTGGENTTCPTANGGRGGRGEALIAPSNSSGIQPGDDAPSGAKGGEAPLFATNRANAGKDGVSHTTPAASGAGGILGAVIADGVRWVNTGVGSDGADGLDGGGGGGGSGGHNGPLASGNAAGLSGAGGGAGGCGGTAGKGGQAGGGSIGLLLYKSNANFTDVTFTASKGGDGGAGGQGGQGGSGGNGGVSTVAHCSLSYAAKSFGGAGGAGGDGQNGGPGGGGAGGSSHGAFCEDSTPTIDNITFVSGTAGAGGSGGPGGQNGATGANDETFGCQL